MNNGGGRQYKYNCRKCPIRDRCIGYSDNSPTIKSATRNAFQNKTDTITTWARLQGNCLLIKAEEERKKGTAESLLSRRLRHIREEKLAKSKAEDAASQKKQAALGSSILSKPKAERMEAPKRPASTQPVTHSSWLSYSNAKQARAPQLNQPGQQTTSSVQERFWLTVARSQRRIVLPDNGELILGRFDPNFGVPPDIDLTYEDRDHHAISRRHALISCQEGVHTIQETGGKYGVKINNRTLGLGTTYQLKRNDSIALGNCKMVYEIVPRWITKLNPRKRIEHWFMINYTGQMIKVEAGKEQIIGRRDKYVKYEPEIDLSILGNAANKVSRRHAHLSFKAGANTLYIEDMGSGFGTKINGEIIMLGDLKPLFPGDHIWLGGCVLTYAITLA